jgi:LacI family transcriptional regulator
MVTLQDIARQTGVSKVTVSYVLNDRETRVRISEETRRRVKEAARQMGYRPNAVARALARRRSDTLTLVMQSPNVFSGGSGFTNEMMRGILDGANHCGFDLMLHTKTLRSLDAEVCALTDGRADGALVLRDQGDPLIGALHERGLPCVAIFSRPQRADIAFVDCDNVAGGRMAVEHLLARGHRRVGFLGGAPASSAVIERRQGYEAALRERGITPRPEWAGTITYADGDFAPLRRMMSLPRSERPTGLFIWSDDVAGRAVAVLHGDLGLRVPDDVSVIGFDGVEAVCARCIPRLTSIRQPVHEMAHRSVEVLAGLIQGRAGGAAAPAPRARPPEPGIRFRPEILAGATCAPARNA